MVEHGHRPNDGMHGQDGILLKDRRGKAGFGSELSCNGFYRVLPPIQFPDKTVFEFDRGSATGVRENVDPFELPYPYSKSDMEKESEYKF